MNITGNIAAAHDRAALLIATHNLEGVAADRAALLLGVKMLGDAMSKLDRRFDRVFRSWQMDKKHAKVCRLSSDAYAYGRIALSTGRRFKLAIARVEKALAAVADFDAIVAADPGEGEE